MSHTIERYAASDVVAWCRWPDPRTAQLPASGYCSVAPVYVVDGNAFCGRHAMRYLSCSDPACTSAHGLPSAPLTVVSVSYETQEEFDARIAAYQARKAFEARIDPFSKLIPDDSEGGLQRRRHAL